MMAEQPEPPDVVRYSLDEALDLLTVLEAVCEDLEGGVSLVLLLDVEHQVEALHP